MLYLGGAFMKKQDSVSPKILSRKLSQFLASLDSKEYQNYGYNECTKKYSSQLVRKQQVSLEDEYNNIWFETAICQPILFWNEHNQLDITGITDYNVTTQLGNLELVTQTGTIEIQNVHSYHVFANISGKYLPTNSRFVPEHHELNDIYVSAIVYKSAQFNLVIYHNTQLIYSMDDVFESEFYNHSELISYTKRNGYVRFSKAIPNGGYSNYLYDINTETLHHLQDSDTIPSCYLNEIYPEYSQNFVLTRQNYRNHITEFLRGPWLKVVVHLNESKTSQVIAEFIKKAELYKVVPNIFPDDPTINVEFIFEQNSRELRFLYYCYQKEPGLFGHGIMGLSLEEIEIGTKNNKDEHNHVYKYSPHYLEQCIYINRDLYERCNEKPAFNRLPLKIYSNCISSHAMGRFLSEYTYHNFQETKNASYPKEDFTQETELYAEIANQIAKSGKLKTKWKNEYALFKIVNDMFPDATYQYHCQWLGHQSLDVYIPSKKIAFEYQGIQHYEAVSFFGGEEHLKNQLERDKRKQQLCHDNGVLLIEWRYDEPVSSTVLKRKLKDFL